MGEASNVIKKGTAAAQGLDFIEYVHGLSLVWLLSQNNHHFLLETVTANIFAPHKKFFRNYCVCYCDELPVNKIVA